MKRIHHTKYEHNRSIFDIVQKFVSNSKLSKMLQICSNSTWWIHLMSWFHTTNMRKIGAFLTMSKISHFISKIWELSKMLRLCSYFVYKINSWKEFITSNMNTIGAFLAMSKKWDRGPNCQKCSNFAQIECDEFFL